ncbi:putative glutathione S-transferase [Apostasia shenzhenica]|uniref:glutathione transferase n=1 Tax=Apostasia shenzhenica TaxID=1088818 RepID=A0A2H9ZR49_9ASPA|nr:putative glutathione S-transferase [Apostasia shenzhenica]
MAGLVGGVFTAAVAGDEEVLLLSWRASVFGLRVRIALEEKGVRYAYKEEDVFNKSDLLLQSNPIHRKVPVLIHGGRSVCESLVILEYVDQVWDPSPSLLPADPYHRASARFWADFAGNKRSLSVIHGKVCIYGKLQIYECERRIRHNKYKDREAAKEELIGHLKLLEELLGDKVYFAGDSFGFLDIALITFSCWFYTFETFGSFVLENECPRLLAWVRRCMERESVAKVLPSPQEVFKIACMVRKKLGFVDEKEHAF